MTYLRIWEHAEREAELKEPLKKVIDAYKSVYDVRLDPSVRPS